MTLRKIAEIGHPVLRQKAKTVPGDQITSPEIQNLIFDMIETLRERNGAGLAAPQVYQSGRIVCIEPTDKDAEKQASPLVLINPKITHRSQEQEYDWEGCLSIPNLWGRVSRYCEITVKALGPQGKPLEIKASGSLARKLQHELDHLNGVLFIDQMANFSTLTNTIEFQRYWYPKFPKPSLT